MAVVEECEWVRAAAGARAFLVEAGLAGFVGGEGEGEEGEQREEEEGGELHCLRVGGGDGCGVLRWWMFGGFWSGCMASWIKRP